MKSCIVYVALAVLLADFIDAKSLKTNIFRERRAFFGNQPRRPGGQPVQHFPLGFGRSNPGMQRPFPGQRQFGPQMRPPPGMPPNQAGPMGQQPMGQQPMGGPGCGGCAQNQGPKMCPAICMRWNTIIKPNGEVENGKASITPLAPNERVGPNGVFPPMTQMMGPMQQPGMMQPGMMRPGMQQPGMMRPGMMQQPYMQPGAGFSNPGAQPPPVGATTAKPTQG
ncbi:proline-rich protein HaeIII subfamily 1-like isoform X2 [Dendronephthya gigantea]|uniref:proline-rich protein HaeIII subfamily 1-like isoform X2 n=1 Tax=Dendronephthya gigantea TaxID=151771 RepID=UPI0010694501|nr:proline-rich protein HaeIII subfamily 1-like isoform X2 [Dendronephthya gigantea]